MQDLETDCLFNNTGGPFHCSHYFKLLLKNELFSASKEGWCRSGNSTATHQGILFIATKDLPYMVR